jgi:hypothetical protein
VTTALAGFVKRGFEAADMLGDAAERIGVTVESLSRLKFAAEQNDVEFGALTIAIKRWQVTLSEAGSGTKSAADSLGLLGLKAGDLKNLRLEDQLAKIADQFQRIQDPADRTRVAVELFGRSGEQLVPLLSKGGAAVRALTEEADRLGITLDGKTVRSIDKADKALKKLFATLGAFGSRVAGGIALAIVGPADELDAAELKLEALQRRFEDISKNRGVFARLNEDAKKANLDIVARQIETTRIEIERLKKAAEDTGEALEIPNKNLEKLQEELTGVNRTVGFLADPLIEMEKQTRTSTQKMGDDFRRLQAQLQYLADQGRITAEEFKNRMDEAVDNIFGTDGERALEELSIRLRKLPEPLTAAQEKVKAFTDSLKDGLQNAVERGKISIKDLVRFIIAELLKRELYKAIDQLGAALSKALSPSGGKGGGFLGAIGSFFGGLFRAGGGQAKAGDIVGEDGPEVLMSNGQVFNRRQLAFAGAGGGGVSVVNHNVFHVDGSASPEQVARYVETRLAQTSRKNAEAIQRLLERNGFGRMR